MNKLFRRIYAETWIIIKMSWIRLTSLSSNNFQGVRQTWKMFNATKVSHFSCPTEVARIGIRHGLYLQRNTIGIPLHTIGCTYHFANLGTPPVKYYQIDLGFCVLMAMDCWKNLLQSRFIKHFEKAHYCTDQKADFSRFNIAPNLTKPNLLDRLKITWPLIVRYTIYTIF